MIDDETDTLPDGTDTVIAGASKVDDGATLEAEDTGVSTELETTNINGSSEPSRSGGAFSDRIRSGREQLAGQAGEKARGLVTQGLERTAEALANVSRMVGDTAPGIEERLGADYADYARRAAGTIENVANSIAEKDPDELIDDTRNFVRNSPGVALAGATIVGFVVARLLKTGLSRNDSDDSAANA